MILGQSFVHSVSIPTPFWLTLGQLPHAFVPTQPFVPKWVAFEKGGLFRMGARYVSCLLQCMSRTQCGVLATLLSMVCGSAYPCTQRSWPRRCKWQQASHASKQADTEMQGLGNGSKTTMAAQVEDHIVCTTFQRHALISFPRKTGKEAEKAEEMQKRKKTELEKRSGCLKVRRKEMRF